MGVVHLARRPGGDRVALKVLRPHIVGDDEARARLAREVSSLTPGPQPLGRRDRRRRPVGRRSRTSPPATCPASRCTTTCVEEGPITGADLTWFAGCLAEGLASVHAVGVLHRDVKPSNVLMEGRTPILIDFGLARVADDPKLTHTGWLLGTPGLPRARDPVRRRRHRRLRRALVGGHRGVRRHRPRAVRPRPVDGDHGPGPPRRARPRRAARRACAASSRPRSTPTPRGGPTLDAAARLAAPADHPGPARPAAGARRDRAAGGPVHRAARARGPGPPGPARAPTDVLPPSTARADGTGRDCYPWDDEDEDDPPSRRWDEPAPEPRLSAGRAGPPAAARRRRPPARGRRADGVPVAVRCCCSSSARGCCAAARSRPAPRATAAGVRGRRWYDGVQFLVAAPWHLVRVDPGHRCCSRCGAPGWPSRPRWSATRSAAGVTASLFACGLVLAGSLLARPGQLRVRSPLARVVNPLAAERAALAGRGAARPRRRHGAPATPWSRTARTGRRPTGRRGAGSAAGLPF